MNVKINVVYFSSANAIFVLICFIENKYTTSTLNSSLMETVHSETRIKDIFGCIDYRHFKTSANENQFLFKYVEGFMNNL